MTDLPCIVLAATIWMYWSCVGAMMVRLRRRTRKLSGIVPSQRVEQFMWLVWVPLVVAWMVLPYLAATQASAPWMLPPVAREAPLTALRWGAVAVGLAALALSIDCWLRMGSNWRMAVTPDQQTSLVTSGLYSRVRHPIYALSILLMLCTVIVAPTLPMAAIGAIHIALMVAKARNEERFLTERHGDAYRRYVRRTGRFLPRLHVDGAGPGPST
ncbi:MAG: isoprenylcysteine carboxylmethyltransferase family protein [Piscinibacter sp.]|nr:isoprenylcysteine carboxylmethyltransferase family protein [Piscinibacter sp.]